MSKETPKILTLCRRLFLQYAVSQCITLLKTCYITLIKYLINKLDNFIKEEASNDKSFMSFVINASSLASPDHATQKSLRPKHNNL